MYVDIAIVDGPQDITVCMNATAAMNCGYTGADPDNVIPNWSIVLRSDNDRINNISHRGIDIFEGKINGLQWVPDLTSGYNTAPNSKLLVGPVNKTQSVIISVYY